MISCPYIRMQSSLHQPFFLDAVDVTADRFATASRLLANGDDSTRPEISYYLSTMNKTDPIASLMRRPHIKWGLLFGFWTIVGLVFVIYNTLLFLSAGVSISAEMIIWTLVGQYFWVLLTPLVVYLAHRYPFGRTVWKQRLTGHIGFAILLVVLSSFIFAAMQWGYAVFSGNEAFVFSSVFSGILFRSFFIDVFIYMILLAVVHAYEYNSRSAILQTQLAQAQLQALRMQLNPHFLFNTLHAISSLMDVDVKDARRMMANLSELLRYSLDNEGELQVPLEEELAFLQRYLKIEQARFQDRLTVSIDVDDQARDALVPNLILQPLVENAIKHGIAPYAAAGTVEIRARRVENQIEIQIRDNGPGLQESTQKIRNGIGLTNTRQRLDQLYGSGYTFDLQNGEKGGLTVNLVVPYQKYT